MINLRSDQISIIDDLAFAMYQDPEIAAIIKNLERKKQEYVHSKISQSCSFSFDIVLYQIYNFLDEKFDQARKFKQAIEELIKVCGINDFTS